MGTRHLIRVIDESGTVKVAQYGQWDGYPDGVGVELLGVLRQLGFDDKAKRHEFNQALGNTVFINEHDIEAINLIIDKTETPLKDIVPALSRDTSADVLLIIAGLAPCGDEKAARDPVGCLRLKDEDVFGQDSTFCAWLYEVNLQEDKLHVRHNDKEDVLASFDLGNLPDDNSFTTMVYAIAEARRAEERRAEKT